MIFGRKGEGADIKLDIEQMDSCRYLVSYVEDMLCTQEIKTRIAIAKEAFNLFYGPQNKFLREKVTTFGV